jgi:DNA-binding MarR family transcriptional regulator
VRLSPAGRELVEATLPRRRRLVEAMLQDFSDQDLNQLITLLGNWESALLKAADKDLL